MCMLAKMFAPHVIVSMDDTSHSYSCLPQILYCRELELVSTRSAYTHLYCLQHAVLVGIQSWTNVVSSSLEKRKKQLNNDCL